MPIASQSVRKPSRVYLRRGHPTARGVLAAVPMMEGAGTNARDISNRANPTPSLENSASWATGPSGPVIDCTASTLDRVQTDFEGFMSGLTALTIVGWFRPDETNHASFARVHTERTGDNIFEIFFQNGGPDYTSRIVSNGSNIDVGLNNVADLEWNFYAKTWRKTNGSGTQEFFLANPNTNGVISEGTASGGDGAIDTLDFFYLGPGTNSNEAFEGQFGVHLWYDWVPPQSFFQHLYEHPMTPFITKPR